MKLSIASSSHKHVWRSVVQNWCGDIEDVSYAPPPPPLSNPPSLLCHICLKATLCFRTAAGAPAVTAASLATGNRAKGRKGKTVSPVSEGHTQQSQGTSSWFVFRCVRIALDSVLYP